MRDAEAILAYLAHRYDDSRRWLPSESAAFDAVMMWLTFAGRDLQAASTALLNAIFEVEANPKVVRGEARQAFRVMDDHMTRREFDSGEWFVGAGATIADLALFPAIALSRDFGIDHDEFPALRRWMRRVRATPGFTAMPGIADYA